MKTLKETHKGYTISKRTDIKNHTCIIYKDNNLIKCIAGDILADGSENSIYKAKKHIDNITS